MATLKELQDQAKLQGIKNVKKYKKSELEAMLATSSTTAETHVEEQNVPTNEAPSNHDFVHLATIGALDPAELIESLRNMEKGAARKVRQALFRAGHRRLAAIPLS